jgi:multidrug efflux pump subunit AcrB
MCRRQHLERRSRPSTAGRCRYVGDRDPDPNHGAAGDFASGRSSRRFRSASIWRPGYALGDAVDEVKTIETRIGMPTSIVGLFAGDAAEFSKSLAGQPWLILAALVTIYIVLGVLYESYIHPITILSTLPSAGVGAILALMLFGRTCR